MMHDPVVVESATSESPAHTHRTNYRTFSALITVSVGLWWGSLAATLGLALGSDAYTYILLVMPLAAALVYFEQHKGPASPTSRKWAGWVLLTLGLLARLTTLLKIIHLSAGNTLCLNMLAVWISWIGSVVLCFGMYTCRRQLFALCFLVLIVPLPDSAINWITETLQYQSAVTATQLFHAARVPATREGVIVSIPGLDLEVARECSSIRSSTLLVIVTLVFAHLFLHCWWTKAILCLAAMPLAIFKNAVRIFTIAELGTRVDPAYLNGHLHHDGGVIFFGLALVITLVLAMALRKAEGASVAANKKPA
jgi:exosortase